jgi:hypothetical protein
VVPRLRKVLGGTHDKLLLAAVTERLNNMLLSKRIASHHQHLLTPLTENRNISQSQKL